jgi:hypothetical protein
MLAGVSAADCTATHSATTTDTQSCRAGHLRNAAAGNPAVHCPHATGVA